MLFYAIFGYLLLLSFLFKQNDHESAEGRHGKGNLFAVLYCIMAIYRENKTSHLSEMHNRRQETMLHITTREILTDIRRKKPQNINS